jgi:signal transduction histidine kinase
MGSLIYTGNLVGRLKIEERENVRMWAEATSLISVADTSQDVEFLSSVIDNNNTVPVILTDEKGNIISARNFDDARIDDPVYLDRILNKIKQHNKPIVISLDNNHFNLIYYKDSLLLTMLMYYPYIQLGIILLFILVSYLAFSSSRRAEQNQVWVGMSKETAHQLGTPTSSLAGWIEVLQEKHPEVSITRELALDVERLEKVTERFSRIGSKPSLSSEDIIPVISRTITYLKSRTSSKVRFTFAIDPEAKMQIPVNTALFEWVIENVFKNAVDSMEGNGEITVKLGETDKYINVDIYDTGKGIPKPLIKKIFNPGFTTKQRGWGLGLSLARRIIEEYHGGKIFVRYSEVGRGSCIRIILNKEKR